MDRIPFSAGTKISPAKVTVDGVDYIVTPAEYDGPTPISPNVLNRLQSNIAAELEPLSIGTGTSFDNITTNFMGLVTVSNTKYWLINIISGTYAMQLRWLCNSTDTTMWRREKVNGTWGNWIPTQAL